MKLLTPKNWLAIILFIIGFIWLCIVSLSCQVIKGKKSKVQDSTSVSKSTVNLVDTTKAGSVSKSETTTKEEFDWYRMTQLFDAKNVPPGDTKIYPTTAVYEGGKGSKETTENKTDSVWRDQFVSFFAAKFDSLNNKITEVQKNKESESKGLGVWLIVICFAVYWVLTKGLSWFTSKYTLFVKK